MDKDKLVLADGTGIMLESAQGIGALNVMAADKGTACGLWKKFTPENLKEVVIQGAAGETIGRYGNVVLDHITGVENANGTILITFSLRNKTKEELLTERISALEAGQETQDAAIGDLGQAVSDMAEGGAH